MSPAMPDGPAGSAPVQKHQTMILPGLGYEEQLEIDYTSLLFRTTWTSKSYTDAAWADRVNFSPSRLKAVHYGNNMTLLFRACIHLNKYLASDNFWTAIARGFRCKAEYAITHVDTLIRARKAYLRQYGNRIKSAATKAIDTWINIIITKRNFAGDASVPIPDDKRLFEAAEHYYADAKTSKFLFRDAANVLSTPPESDMARRPPKRSRSPSLSVDDEPFSAGFKRRTRPSDGRPVDSPSTDRSGWGGLPPLKTDFQEPDYARRPSSPSLQPPHDAYPGEALGRIRGFSSHSSLPLRPPTVVSEGFPQHSPQNDSLEHVNELRLRDRTDMLEKKLAETEAQRAKDSAQAQTRIAALEAKLTAQQDQTAASQALLTRMSALEDALAGKEQPSQGIWGKLKSFDERLAGLENTANGPEEEYLKGLGPRITSLESGTKHTSQQADADRARTEKLEIALNELRQRFAELTNQDLKAWFHTMTIMVNDIKSSRVSHESLIPLQDKIIMLDDRVDKFYQSYPQPSEVKILNRQVEENMAQNAVLEEQITSLRESQEATALRITELVNLLQTSFA